MTRLWVLGAATREAVRNETWRQRFVVQFGETSGQALWESIDFAVSRTHTDREIVTRHIWNRELEKRR